MNKRFHLFLLGASGILISHAQGYKPVEVTGFNHDVIAESSKMDAFSSTTIEMDALDPSNFVIFSKSFAKSAGMPTGYGLPDNGRITSGGKVYQLAPFNVPNALYLKRGATGILTTPSMRRITSLSILLLATEGPVALSIRVVFTDRSARSATTDIHDWFDGPSPVISGFGRVKREKGKAPYYEGAPSNPRMYSVEIDLPGQKAVHSVQFRNITPGANPESNRVFVFALSGFAPEPEKTETTPVITETAKKYSVPVVVVPTQQTVTQTVQPKEEPKKTEEQVTQKVEVLALHGTIWDDNTHLPIQAVLTFAPKSGSVQVVKSIDGKYNLTGVEKAEYTIDVTSPGYLDQKKVYNLQVWPPNNELNFALQRIEVGTRVSLKHVLFKQSTPVLLEQSYHELDSVADFLKFNPAVRIDLAGHTDNRGSKKANLKLSTDRANAVKSYLVNKGIDPARITGQGYGGNKPIAPNDKEESRKLNRRVELTITDK